MRQHLIASDARPQPWGDPASDWPILGRVAHARLAEALESPLLPNLPGEWIALPTNLLLSADFLTAFMHSVAARRAEGDRRTVFRAQLGEGASARRSRGRSGLSDCSKPGEGLALPLISAPEDNTAPPPNYVALLDAARDAEAIVIDPLDRSTIIATPKAYREGESEGIEVAASSRIAIHLEHRSHLQQANLEFLGAELLGALGKPKWQLALRYLWERFRPGPRRLFSRLGSGCKIHPTAVIEGSMLGEGCEVGAYALVRGSILGPGAVIEDGAHVQMCSLGANARVARQTSVFASVLMDGAHSAQTIMQMSVLGRDTATTTASWFLDVKLDKNVRVEAPPLAPEGAPTPGPPFRDAGTRFLGVDVGHEAFLGAGVYIAPGRMVPSHCRLVANPDLVLSSLGDVPPDATGGTFTVRKGRLEPIQ